VVVGFWEGGGGAVPIGCMQGGKLGKLCIQAVCRNCKSAVRLHLAWKLILLELGELEHFSCDVCLVDAPACHGTATHASVSAAATDQPSSHVSCVKFHCYPSCFMD
jgi:hypothetical protein